MKVRNGFVSNSSSSSFAIFGVELSEEELNSLTDGVDARDAFEEVGLDYYGYDGYGAAVGIDIYSLWAQVPQELRDQIMAPVKEKLEKVLKKPVQVGFVSGEYPT